MLDQNITCPSCGTSIPLTDALTQEIRHRLEKEIEKKLDEERTIIADKMKKEIAEKDLQIEQIKKAANERESQVAKAKQEIEKQKDNLNAEIEKKVNEEKEKLLNVATEKAEAKLATELKDLGNTNKEQSGRIEEMQKQELKFREEKRELERKEKSLELEMARKLDEERSKIANEAKKEAAEKDLQMEHIKKAANEKESQLAKAKQEIEKQKDNLNAEIEKKVNEEKGKLLKVATEKAGAKLATELRDLENANKEQSSRIEEMQKRELKFREEKRELERKEKSMELDVAKKVDFERNKIYEEAKKETTETYRMKLSEKDLKMKGLIGTIEELKRKSEQGSMQIQGEAQEIDLKRLLQSSFPVDIIDDVPTGIRGGDIVQKVRTPLGKEVGIILWESKNTKLWGNDWTKKLRDDQAIVKADLCILVSKVLPSEIENFGLNDGIWITNYQSVIPFVSTLRFHLIEISASRQSLIGKGEKMEHLYSYLTGNEFKNRINNIVEAFKSLKSDLETEKRSMQRIWSKREKELDRVITNTTEMYGAMQGIAGSSLPTLKALELPEGGEVEE